MRSELQKGAVALCAMHTLHALIYAVVTGHWMAWALTAYVALCTVWIWLGGWGGHGPAVEWKRRLFDE